MTRTVRDTSTTILVVLAWVLAGVDTRAEDPPPSNEDRSIEARSDDPVPAPAPTPIFVLRQQEDLPGFLQRLDSPDFFFLDADGLQKLLERARQESREADVILRSGVTRVSIKGQVLPGEEIAELSIEYEIVTKGPGPHWVPIGLDGLNPKDARMGDRSVGWRSSSGRWSLLIPDEGRSTVRVELRGVIRTIDERRSLELAIPETLSTHVRLDVPYPVRAAEAGAGAPVMIESIDAGQTARLEANLPARPRLNLSWIPQREPGEAPTPLLTAKGGIEIEVNSRYFLARSQWTLRVERGSTRTVAIELQTDEELLGVELDGRPILAAPSEATSDEDTFSRWTLSLPSTLPVGQSTFRLDVTTRRAIRPEDSSTFCFQGHHLRGLAEQSGFVTVTQPDDLRVQAQPVTGLRPIDPRELPETLRTRPAIGSAFQFDDQPFDLTFEVSVAPPRVQVESRTLVAVDPNGSQVETWLDYLVTRGSVFEVDVVVPAGLVVQQIGPPETVEDWELLPSELEEDGTNLGGRRARLRLTEDARDDGRFRVELSGYASSQSNPERLVPFFRADPHGFERGRVAVLPARNVRANLAGGPTAPLFLTAVPLDPDDWPRPSVPSAYATQPTIWLRHEVPAFALPIRVEGRERMVYHRSNLNVTVSRTRIDVQQDVDCSIRNESIQAIEIAVPVGLDWELVDRSELSGEPEPLGDSPDGSTRYRLNLAREFSSGSLRLRFRYALRSGWELLAGQPSTLELNWIQVHLEGTSEPLRIRVFGDSDLALEPEGENWQAATLDAIGPPDDVEEPLRWVWVGSERPGSDQEAITRPRLVVTPLNLAELPRLLASILWLRSVLTPEGELRTTAWYRVEGSESHLAVALPEGSRLVSASVDGRRINEIERLHDPNGVRVRFPSGTPSTGVVVRLDYRGADTAGSRRWVPPVLLDGGEVQQALWEVRVPWSQAVVGVGDGWADENQWYWGGYVWKRRPRSEHRQVLAGIIGASSESELGGFLTDEDGVGDHGYLFGRPGPPVPLQPRIVSRAWLVALCSGTILAMGFLWLIWRPSGQWLVIALPMLLLVVVVSVRPSTLFVLAQCSALGLGLVLVAAVTQAYVERRRPLGSGRFREGGMRGAPSASSSGSGSSPAPVLVGSEDSTAVRPRPPLSGSPPSTTRTRPPAAPGAGMIDIPSPHRNDSSET